MSIFAGKEILMKKRTEDLVITENRKLADGFFLLKLSSSLTLPVINPGQFVQVRVPDSSSTFLRRPLSVHDVDHAGGSLSLLIQVAGAGTDRLSQMVPGDKLNLLYPLGNSFTLPKSNERVLLVGGGSGMAPLLFLGRTIRDKGIKTHFLLGFRNRERILDYTDYEAVGTVEISVEDGSAGHRGYVTDNPLLTGQEWDRIYCCGPEPMMKAVAAECRERAVFCEVSLEKLMACGTGICLCCVVPTTSGNLCSCTDGPVFNINDLKWQT